MQKTTEFLEDYFVNDSERRGREDEKEDRKKNSVFTLKNIPPKRKMPPVPPLLSVLQISFLKYIVY